MSKLSFKWKMSAEEAKPNQRDIDDLREQHIVFQLDFLQDVIFEAKKLYEETLELSEEFWRKKQIERENAASTH